MAALSVLGLIIAGILMTVGITRGIPVLIVVAFILFPVSIIYGAVGGRGSQETPVQ